VQKLQAVASVEPAPRGSGLLIVAEELNTRQPLQQTPERDPLGLIVRLTLRYLDEPEPDAILSVHSTIPMASGLGSGAAVSTAMVRALTGFLGHSLPPKEISRLVFAVEKLHHGTPSGIDNTVVTFERAVFFVKGRPVETFEIGTTLHFLIADTGLVSPTRVAVGDVRRAWQQDRVRYEALFEQIGAIVNQARQEIERGDADVLGRLMDRNHALVQALGVSCPELEGLVTAARGAGALGAKLSGAGRGGNMIALVGPEVRSTVTRALRHTGARRVIESSLLPASTDSQL
jgi:mevalonate kinase